MVSRWHFLVAVVVSVFAFAGTAQATPTFLSAIDLSDAGQDGFQPQVGVDGSGNVHVRLDAFRRQPLPDPVLHADGEWRLERARRTSPTPARTHRTRSSRRPVRQRCSSCGRAPTARTSASRPPSSVRRRPSPPGHRLGPGLRRDAARRSTSTTPGRRSLWQRFDGTNLRVQATTRTAGSGGTFANEVTLSEPGPGRVQPAGRRRSQRGRERRGRLDAL